MLSFVACSSGDDISDVSDGAENNAAAQYAVGSSITLDDGVEYIVVDNPAASGSSVRSASRAAALSDEDTQLLIKAKSVKKAIEIVHTQLQDNAMVVIRAAGKITVPNVEQEADYAQTKAEIAAAFPQGTDVSEYYEVNQTEGKDEAYYRDMYYAVTFSGDTFTKIGQIETIWNEQDSFTLDDGSTVKLRELLKNYRPAIIRKKMSEKFKLFKYEEGVSRQILLYHEEYYDESENLKGVSKCFNYYRVDGTEIKIVPSLTIKTTYEDSREKKYKGTTIVLLGIYGNETNSPCLHVYVNPSNEQYSYSAKGTSNEDDSPKTSSKSFSFKNGKYTATDYIDASNLKFGPECTLYNGKAYNRDALLIPVDFVLNDDGTVSLGEKMEAWAKRWWQFVIANNEGATTLDGKKETYTEPDYVKATVTAADILVASTNDEKDGVSFTIKVPRDDIRKISLYRKPENGNSRDAIEVERYNSSSTKIPFEKGQKVPLADEFVKVGKAYTYTIRFTTTNEDKLEYLMGTVTPKKGSGELNVADKITLSYDSENNQLTLTGAATFAESAITASQQIRVRYKCEGNTIDYILNTDATSFDILSDKKGVIKNENLYGKEMTFNQFILDGRKTNKAADSLDFVYSWIYEDKKNLGDLNITLDESAKTITLPAKPAE